ncbi:HAUS augmin-like complex subunit 3 [Corythoichthys intestinalis]|uniref:HAUS augmin-like complex subunit 3 n=1 Tax=Corythoichthys intestinalis TaxID=161448 RepID=UPI0025A4FB99|nr:HAUS augmin-like complex subunit 3 [Corythoichthys intestinalis]XP_057712387.1 HAUS augmin-like complex subunit 3 [Corythoichthys intestinalis]XP_061810812.1 HAUS augmin-like complex subunit 3 [Nerophis lumbriciformis]
MSSGKDFVEAMARLGYPGASALEASEFDWLFTGLPENRLFLDFICQGLSQRNVLTPEEVQAFDELQKSGKPILDQENLDKLLKNVSASEANHPAVDGKIVEDLEAELKALRKEKKQKQKRLEKLEAAVASRADVEASLSSKLDGVSSRLKEAKAFLGAENASTNAGLKSMADETGELTSCLLTRDLIDEHFTKTLSALVRKHFFGDVVEQVQEFGSSEDKEKKVEEVRTILAKLEQLHIVALHQLIEAAAEEKSLEAGLDWLTNKSMKIQCTDNSSSLEMYKTDFEKELRAVEAEIEALRHGPLPIALRKSAKLFTVPLVKADQAMHLARQDYSTLRKNQLRDKLLHQKAAFDILHLNQQVVFRKWREFLKHLGDVNSRLVKESEDASLRLEALKHHDLALNVTPSPIVGSRDATFKRLAEILDRESSSGRLEPFWTYEAVEQAAGDLSSNLQAAREALAAAGQERGAAVAELQDHGEALDEALTTELQQLVLGPQLCLKAIAGQELLCPNAKELKEKLSEADSQLQRLLKSIQDISGDINAKRSQLARDPHLVFEREVYAYFHSNIAVLQKVVEDLERKQKLTRGKP